MVVVALAEAAAIVVIVAGFLRAFSAQQRSHARREDLLVNQLLHAAGNAWTPPPVDEWREKVREARDERRDFERRYTPTPEQLPIG